MIFLYIYISFNFLVTHFMYFLNDFAITAVTCSCYVYGNHVLIYKEIITYINLINKQFFYFIFGRQMTIYIPTYIR